VETLTREDIAKRLISSGESTQKVFRAEFGRLIEAFIGTFHHAYTRFGLMASRVPAGKRAGWVQMFLFGALNSIFTSVQLLLSGHQLSSGNMMRQFGEAVAMVLLCSHPKIDTFDRFDAHPKEFPVHKAVQNVKKNIQLLGLSEAGWEDFQKITFSFHPYSHASAFALSSLLSLSTPRNLILGGRFDYDKIVFYEKELRLTISACRVIEEVIGGAEKNLLA